MPKNLKRYGQADATSLVAQQPARMDGFVNIGPALVRSPVTRLFGRPYPVLFRAQGALDAWTHALGNTGLWPRWQAPGTPCWQIRQELLRQLECTRSSSSLIAQTSEEDCQRLAFQVSTNLKYHLSEGTAIEATAALETLQANSDVDCSLSGRATSSANSSSSRRSWFMRISARVCLTSNNSYTNDISRES